MRSFAEWVALIRPELLERKPPMLIRTPNRKSPHVEAALQLVEEGLAHASRAKGSGPPGWWIHFVPGENAEDFAISSRRAMGDFDDD